MIEMLDAPVVTADDVLDQPPIPDGLPKIGTYRVMVMPIQPRKKSLGGIVLPEQVQDNEQTLTYIGRVVAMGPLCYAVEPLNQIPESDRAKVGDWVMYGRYNGQKVDFKGFRFLVMNEDELLGTMDSPVGFRQYA